MGGGEQQCPVQMGEGVRRDRPQASRHGAFTGRQQLALDIPRTVYGCFCSGNDREKQ